MKKLKKVASAAVLATSLVMTGVVQAMAADVQTVTKTNTYIEPTLAEGTMTEEQAIAKARAMFPNELKNLQMERATFQEKFYLGTAPCWNLSFSNLATINKSNSKTKLPNVVNIVLNAKTGTLLQFNHNNQAQLGTHAPNLDVVEAAANQFLKTYAPELEHDFKSEGIIGAVMAHDGDNPHTSAAIVSYVEQVNGIPFPKNNIQIDVDEFGNVIRYTTNMTYDASKLPTPDHVLPADRANAIYAQKLTMNKMYATRRYSKQTGKVEVDPRLMYMPGGFSAIDAFTGQEVQIPYLPDNTEPMHDAVSLDSNGVSAPKTSAEATELVGHLLNLDLTTYKVEEEKTPEDVVYSWIKQRSDHEVDRIVNASFDPQTGQVNTLTQFSGDVGDTPKLTIEEGQQKVQDILKHILPKGHQDLLLVRQNDDKKAPQTPDWYKSDASQSNDREYAPNTYSYHYTFTYQGVTVRDHYIDAKVNRTTGEIIGVFLSPSVIATLPDNNNTVSADAAKITFVNNTPLHLEYIWDSYGTQSAPQGELVYVPDYNTYVSNYVDPFTGKLVSQYN
ncbi:MAG: YcdB/YcdC domain-containing protein [Tumebacillaceae bacterium]